MLSKFYPCNSNLFTDRYSPPERQVLLPLRIVVSDVYRTPAISVAVGGKVESGTLRSGQRVLIMPANELAVVKCDVIFVFLPALSLIFTLVQPLNVKVSTQNSPSQVTMSNCQ